MPRESSLLTFKHHAALLIYILYSYYLASLNELRGVILMLIGETVPLHIVASFHAGWALTSQACAVPWVYK